MGEWQLLRGRSWMSASGELIAVLEAQGMPDPDSVAFQHLDCNGCGARSTRPRNPLKAGSAATTPSTVGLTSATAASAIWPNWWCGDELRPERSRLHAGDHENPCAGRGELLAGLRHLSEGFGSWEGGFVLLLRGGERALGLRVRLVRHHRLGLPGTARGSASTTTSPLLGRSQRLGPQTSRRTWRLRPSSTARSGARMIVSPSISIAYVAKSTATGSPLP